MEKKTSKHLNPTRCYYKHSVKNAGFNKKKKKNCFCINIPFFYPVFKETTTEISNNNTRTRHDFLQDVIFGARFPVGQKITWKKSTECKSGRYCVIIKNRKSNVTQLPVLEVIFFRRNTMRKYIIISIRLYLHYTQ